jgi:hypothetical protein
VGTTQRQLECLETNKAPRLGAALAYYTTFSLALLPQPRGHTPPVMPQGMRSVSSPDYRRYRITVLSFVAGMVIGARRRARYS